MFLLVCCEDLMKTLWDKEKLLVITEIGQHKKDIDPWRIGQADSCALGRYRWQINVFRPPSIELDSNDISLALTKGGFMPLID